ncbi:MAG: serine hydrolase domain-containing protein [Pseudomonadota bacterium]
MHVFTVSLWYLKGIATALVLSSTIGSSAVAQSVETIGDETLAAVDQAFSDTVLDTGAPGLIYGVVLRDGTVETNAFGARDLETRAEIDGDTAFRIASMTKMLTALLVLDLQDQGFLSLDDPAEDYVPALKDWEYPTTDSRKVQVRDLLMHTSGFIWDDPWADRQMARTQDEIDEFLNQAKPFSNVPGTEYEYSNLGYAILGQIIQNITGKSYADVLKQRIFDPLGMTRSTLEYSDLPKANRAVGYNLIAGEYVIEPVLASGTFDPLGGVWTTANDYTKLMTWMLGAWPARDGPETGAIPRRVVRALGETAVIRAPVRPLGRDGGSGCLMSRGYGMGVVVQYHCQAGPVLGHGGGFPGYGSHVLLAPEKGIAVFAFANETYARSRFATWDAMSALLKAGIGTSKQHLPPAPEMLGVYENIGAAFEAGTLDTGALSFADNFLLDQDMDRWNRQLAEMNETAGTCDVSAPLKHDGRLSGAFEWTCERGRVAGYMTVSPLDAGALQNLQMRVRTRDRSGRDLVIDYDWH